MQPKHKSLRSDFIRFATATAASLMVFSLYSMVDGLMVSWGVSEYAMGAVNLSLPFTNLLFSIAVMFAVGSSTIIAIHLAQEKRHEADELFSQNFWLLLGIGVVISLVVVIFREQVALLLGADEVTLDYVKEYLLGVAPFSACFIISYNLEVLIKTDGFPRLALITVITGALTNCVLDYVAIFWLDMGVFGAALATGISQMVTCIIYLVHFFGPKCTFRLRKFRFNIHIYKRLLPIGIADGVTELCNGLMILLFNRTVQKYLGADGLVTYTVIAYMNTIVINLMMGISQGSQPLVSFHYGKSDRDGCNKLLRYALTAVAVIGVPLFIALYIFAPQVVSTYLSESSQALIETSIVAFRQYGFSWLLVGFNVVIGGYLTALERPVPAICISVGRGLVVQAIVLVTLAAITQGAGIWFTALITEAAVLVMAIFFLRSYLKKTNAAVQA